MTYVDDGGIRYYRHRPEPVRTFEARVTIPGRCDGLVLNTPDGIHAVEIVLLAHRLGEMRRVLRVQGLATPDGHLQVTVTNELSGEMQVIEVETEDERAQKADGEELQR